MAPSTNVLLFPHEHGNLLAALHELSVRAKTRPQLSDFLRAATTALQHEVAALDVLEQTNIGPFEDLVDLAERHSSQPRHEVVVQLVLLSTVQIAQLLILAEDDTTILSPSSIPIGCGYGLIAAAVASVLNSPQDVASIGLAAVVTAFRLAVELRRISHSLEYSNASWAKRLFQVKREDVEMHLHAVNSSLKPLHRAYVGQVFPDELVIFGPPSTLSLVAESKVAGKNATGSIDIGCLLYGPHLPAIDGTAILAMSEQVQTTPVQRRFYSAHCCSPPATSFGELLRNVTTEIAKRPMYTEQVFETVAEVLEKTERNVVLTTVGSTWDASSFEKTLHKHDITVRIGELPPCPKPFGSNVESTPTDAIAVVGMSGRFPESDTLDELWSLLMAGSTTHQEIPKSRFNVDDFYDTSRKTHNALVQRYGCFIKKPGDFDHRLFNISPREALQMDPVQRMLLMTTYEALEMAGYSDNEAEAPPKIAAYFGQTVDDWKTIQEQQGIDTHFLPAVNRGFAPGRLCHFFKWAGGFYSIDTGCSSSATGICIARDALKNGQCDAAVVGGGTLLTAPEWFSGLGQGGFLSPTGACKTFTDKADGYCRGEGVAVVVLKRLSDAIKAKDNVLAVIAGAARNTNAGEGSITHPGANAQETLYRRTLRQAAIRPNEVNVVEMHGTGTQAGDKVETTAVHNVFANPNLPKREQPLIVSAIKANIGHSEAAAGLISMMKGILMLNRDTVPAQANQSMKLNQKLLSLLGPGADMQLASGQRFPRKGTDPRYVFVNNFDAAGGNCSILIHEAPAFAKLAPPTESDARSHHVIVTSGRTDAAQANNKERLQKYLIRNPDTHLASLAYTTTARRMHHAQREEYVASTVSELLKQMSQPTKTLPSVSSVVFAFTGQGSQYVGMGGTLYRTSLSFRRMLDSYQQLCYAQGLSDCQFLNTILKTGEAASADAENVDRDIQVATVALEIALARYWQSLGIQPTMLIGHSLGEYAALCIAGVISTADALALAYERAKLFFSKCAPGEAGMLAVALPEKTVRWRIRDLPATSRTCEICCINGPSSTVVGGPNESLDALDEYLKSDGNIATTRLRTKHAFHTRQTDVVLDDLEAHASRIAFKAPKIPISSTLLGKVIQSGDGTVFNPSYIRSHTREAVAFYSAVRSCESEGSIQDQSFVVEVGPHPTCVNLMALSLEKARPTSCFSLRRGHNDWESISQVLAAAYRAQLPVSWQAFHRDYHNQVQLLNGLPTYAFDCQNFWVPYVTPSVVKAVRTDKAETTSSRLSSTSLHSVEEIRKDGNNLTAKFNVDLSERHLADAIGGHIVDGVAICPASIFIDMAYTAATFIETETRKAVGSALESMELSNLIMSNPLVLRKDMTAEELPLVTLEAVLDDAANTISIRFLSRKAAGQASEHGSCVMRLGQLEAPVTRAWSRLAPLVQARVKTLEASARPRQVHAMDRHLFYKVFSEIVDYSAPYHAVEEAIVAADFHDAGFLFQLPAVEGLGTFNCNPFAVDAAIHVAGFLLNADVRKPKDDVHIANYIGSLHVLRDLSSRGPWQAYATVREQDAKQGTSMCDVYVTDGQARLVVVCTDICFKKLDRGFFALLTGSNRAVASKPRNATVKPVKPVVESHSSDSSTASSSMSSSPSISSQSDTVDFAAELLSLVAAKTGVSLVDLRKDTKTTFTDFGVDSQMSIEILADFQKVTAVELPAAFFSNFSTPAAVEQELGMHQLDDIDEPLPRPKQRKSSIKRRSRKQSPAPKSNSDIQLLSTKLFRIVGEALGLEDSAFTAATTFESLGLDSMLSVKTLSDFQAQTQMELPAAFFTEHQTVAAAQKELDGSDVVSPTLTVAAQGAATSTVVATATNASPRQQKIDTAVSRSVLIQGQSRSKSVPLFMTTDGSGTVESYIHLKALPEGRRIYALESPFLLDTDSFDLTIEEMASIFVRTIRRIQPRGPYLIGGWSAGSVYAYEVAHRLMRDGEDISGLFILDMRAPSLIPTAIVTPDFVDKLGTFEGINRARDLPEDLSVKEKDHLMATCRALSRYDAPAFPLERRPKTNAVVWARLGLDQRPDASKACMLRPGLEIGKTLEDMELPDFQMYFNSWFYGRRETFGMNGWEDLLGDNIEVYDVDGDHFSMMIPPFASAVGDIVVDVVTRATKS